MVVTLQYCGLQIDHIVAKDCLDIDASLFYRN